jgi:phage FluMu gp28-like protein
MNTEIQNVAANVSPRPTAFAVPPSGGPPQSEPLQLGVPPLGGLPNSALRVPRSEFDDPQASMFLPYQQKWIDDESPLKIVEKSRQIGFTYADACDSVFKAADSVNGNDVWISSRDENTALVYLEHCKRWAKALNFLAHDLGARFIDSSKDIKAYVLKFSSGFSIYSLSSCPDALVGKTGHIKLDEFAIHRDQRQLFAIAKPCTTWGGQLAIISTHRGVNTTFNEIIRSIKEQGNPMGFSHHRVTIHDAVSQGLVDRINKIAGRNQLPSQFIQRLRSECLDEEQWQQEYCCQPSDENSAFITWEMITACETPNCLRPFNYLTNLTHLTHSESHALTDSRSFFVGVDVARKHHLTVIDVGEKIGDTLWDRLRIELHDKKFSEIEEELHRILRLPSVKRCCIDATGIGMQLAERAKERFRSKVEPITFTTAMKEELAFALRRAFEDRRLRIDPNPKLRADLRAIKKVVTSAGNIRFLADEEVGRGVPAEPCSHCDRFWAKALRQHAADTKRSKCGAMVVYDHWDSGWSGGYTGTAGIISGLSRFCQ